LASGLPAHREAVLLIEEMYERYTLEFVRVSHAAATESGRTLAFEPYDALAATA
jgi:hypothetical protein